MLTYRGVVKWFDEIKGYGYIQCDEKKTEVFVHFSDIVQEKGFRTLAPGTLVEFEMISGEHGPRAINVVKLAEQLVNRQHVKKMQ